MMVLQESHVKAIADALHAALKSDTIHTVTLKLSSFWLTRPAVWFAQVEVQYTTCQPPIEVNLTKYNYIVAALDIVATGEVEALILSPLATNSTPP